MSEYNFEDDLFGSGDNNDFEFASEHPFDDEPLPMPEPGDEIEELRNRTARGDAVDSDLAMDADFDDDDSNSKQKSSGGSSFSFDQFSSGQRVVLAVFAFVDVLLIIFGLLLILNIL